jgi:hypothetical protein
MLTCLNPWAIHLHSLACLLWYSSLVECDMCSRLFIYCIYTTRIVAQTWRLLLSTRRACHQSAACGVPFWRSAATCSLWWFIVETLGHVMVLILSFTLWHCIWYSLSHYVCVTWSWRTCNLCIRVCLQIWVWHLPNPNTSFVNTPWLVQYRGHGYSNRFYTLQRLYIFTHK